jgi:beta-lactamase class A
MKIARTTSLLLILAAALAMGQFLSLGALIPFLAGPDKADSRAAGPTVNVHQFESANLADGEVEPLGEAQDASLQLELERVVRRQGLWGAVEKGELALLLAIVTDPERPRLAQLNGHRMMYAASLPKIAILFGAVVSLERGRLQLTRSLYRDMVDMIRVSCNDCATRVLAEVGREELIELLQAPEYEFYDPDGEGGLWVGKDYGPSQAYHRDPLHGLSHGATAFQAARLYYRLQTGTLVGPEYTRLMLEALSRPAIEHKFVKGLKGIPGVEILRKSGSWRNYHSDSALVHYQGQTYIMVGLSSNPNGGQWLTQLAAPLNELAGTQGRDNRRLAKLAGSAP